MQLVELIERAEQGSNDLDAMMAEMLGHDITWSQTRQTMIMFPVVSWKKPHLYAGMTEPCPRFTESVDDIFRLINQMNPDFEMEFKYSAVTRRTEVKFQLTQNSPIWNASAKYPAQAMSLAFVKAHLG